MPWPHRFGWITLERIIRVTDLLLLRGVRGPGREKYVQERVPNRCLGEEQIGLSICPSGRIRFGERGRSMSFRYSGDWWHKFYQALSWWYWKEPTPVTLNVLVNSVGQGCQACQSTSECCLPPAIGGGRLKNGCFRACCIASCWCFGYLFESRHSVFFLFADGLPRNPLKTCRAIRNRRILARRS